MAMTTKKAPTLVVLQLAGGNDTINTIVPHSNSLYYDNRKNVRINADDVLKIDSTFISGSGDECLAQARLTETIISLARTLDLTSIAEGVETFEQARQLSAMGCNLVQGYVFARPLRRDAVVALLGDRLSTAFRRRQLAA